MDPILKIIADDQQLITYRPNLRQITGSVTATILLQQILFRWQGQGRKPFYKFKEPCNHKAYKEGDSWTEELGFAPKEFDNAIKKIGYKKGKNKTFKQMTEKDAFVVFYTDKDRMTWYEVNEQNVLDAINGIYLVTEQKGDSYTTKGGIVSKPPKGSYPYTETTAKNTTKNTTVGEKSDNTENSGKGKDSVPDKPGKKDSVSDNIGKGIEGIPNSYTVSVDDSFLKDFVEKNKEKDFRSVSLCEILLNRAESMDFPAKDNIGNVAKFIDKKFRFNRKYEKGEISGALELYQVLPINSLHRQNMTEYIKHEWQKWDFSKTKNENTVRGQFILEYILWHPVYAHFKSVKEQGLLAQDISNYAKRNRKPKNQEQPEHFFDPDQIKDFMEMTA